MSYPANESVSGDDLRKFIERIERLHEERATGNSEVVARLRAGRRVWPETEQKVRAFIRTERQRRLVAA